MMQDIYFIVVDSMPYIMYKIAFVFNFDYSVWMYTLCHRQQFLAYIRS